VRAQHVVRLAALTFDTELWRTLYRDWAMVEHVFILASVQHGKLPASAQYLFHDGDTIHFLVDIPTPRTLQVLDEEAKALIEGCAYSLLTEAKVKELLDYNLFNSQEETTWYWSHRNVIVEYDPKTDVVAIDLVRPSK
jgi:hypothetical protein